MNTLQNDSSSIWQETVARTPPPPPYYSYHRKHMYVLVTYRRGEEIENFVQSKRLSVEEEDTHIYIYMMIPS